MAYKHQSNFWKPVAWCISDFSVIQIVNIYIWNIIIYLSSVIVELKLIKNLPKLNMLKEKQKYFIWSKTSHTDRNVSVHVESIKMF